MFSTFKITIIYLIIISRHTCISVPIDKATPNIREIVKENMVDFNNILVNIADDKIRFKLEGKVEEVIKRAVEAEIKNEMLLQDNGRIEQEKTFLILSANKIAVLPALRTKLEWYENLWYTGGKNSDDFLEVMAEPIAWSLDENTKSNMDAHAKKWDAILTSSPHPGARELKKKVLKIFPGLKTGQISRYFGLLYARLNNAQHGPVGQEGLRILGNTDAMIEALESWNALDDPKLIDLLRVFQEVTTTSTKTSKSG